MHGWLRAWVLGVVAGLLALSGCDDTAQEEPDAALRDAAAGGDLGDGGRDIDAGSIDDLDLGDLGDLGDGPASDAPASLRRVLFIVDTSASMGMADPYKLRVSEIQRALDDYADDLETGFAIIAMNTQALAITPEFTRDRSLLGEALLQLSQTRLVGSFAKATALGDSFIAGDIARTKLRPNAETRYLVFLLSDGGYPAGERDDTLANIDQLRARARNAGVRGLGVHTALLIDPGVPASAAQLSVARTELSEIASRGGGTFVDYHATQALDYAALIGP